MTIWVRQKVCNQAEIGDYPGGGKMKRYLLISLFFVVAFSCIGAQIKIGDITVSESIAKDYFLWCYQNPDTTWFYQYGELKSEIEKRRIEEEDFQRKLAKAKTHKDSVKLIGERFNRMDIGYSRTLTNEESQLMRHNLGTVDRKEETNDIIYYYTGYLTKREPTARGFSEWYIKRGNK